MTAIKTFASGNQDLGLGIPCRVDFMESDYLFLTGHTSMPRPAQTCSTEPNGEVSTKTCMIRGAYKQIHPVKTQIVESRYLEELRKWEGFSLRRHWIIADANFIHWSQFELYSISFGLIDHSIDHQLAAPKIIQRITQLGQLVFSQVFHYSGIRLENIQ